MNRPGNRRTRKEGPSDLNFQNPTLPKNRSWPRDCSTTGQFQTINASLLNYEEKFAEVLEGGSNPKEDDYEVPRFHVAGPWKSMKILPARPLKESEYADTRCFKGVLDAPLPLDGKTSLPTERQAWNMQVNKPISKDIRSQHVKGDKPTMRKETPVPLPRLPVIILPKKCQPLPTEPESSQSPLPQRHTFPSVQKESRQISLKNLSEVLGTEKVPYQQMKPDTSHLYQNQSTLEISYATTSSSSMMRNHSAQNRAGQRESMPSPTPWRHRSPGSGGPSAGSQGRPSPTRPEEEAVPNSEWYVGEYSRHEVEEALLKENKDGTFLVRDCSVRSRAEPYVLVVFYGNKVYNVKIRFLERNQQFALGTGLRGDEKFDSVEDIIEHYKYFPIVLVDGKDKTGTHREQCFLTQPLPFNKLSSPR